MLVSAIKTAILHPETVPEAEAIEMIKMVTPADLGSKAARDLLSDALAAGCSPDELDEGPAYTPCHDTGGSAGGGGGGGARAGAGLDAGDMMVEDYSGSGRGGGKAPAVTEKKATRVSDKGECATGIMLKRTHDKGTLMPFLEGHVKPLIDLSKLWCSRDGTLPAVR